MCEQDQIELERSASCQWEKVKGDIVVGSMSGRGCVAWEEGDGAEEEGTGKGPDPSSFILILILHPSS